MNNRYYNINFSLDIALHVLILFTFLTIFFFAYVSKLEKQTLDDTITNSVKDNTDTLLTDINQLSQKYNIKVNWDEVNNIAATLVKNSQGEVPQIKENNDRLYKSSMIAIIIGFILFVLLWPWVDDAMSWHNHDSYRINMTSYSFKNPSYVNLFEAIQIITSIIFN